MGLITSYPAWFILLCIISGLLYSGILYYRNRKKNFNRPYNILLPVFRFISIFLITFLLLEPLIRIKKRIYDVPVIAVVQDNSSSIITGTDSAYLYNDVLPAINDWITKHDGDAEIVRYTFGENFNEGDSINFKEGTTDMSRVFSELKNRYYRRNLQGVVLISDGIYNAGINPLNALAKIQAPVYTVALGDTTDKTDLAVNSLIGNREVLLNNYFPIELSIRAVQAGNERSRLVVKHNGETIYNQEVNILSNDFSRLINLKSLANKKGLNKITVSFEPIDAEKNISNNYRTFYFNVIEDRKKIVIFAQAPQTDMISISPPLGTNKNFDVSVFSKTFPVDEMQSADLLILHQLPSNMNRAPAVMQYIKDSGIPVWFIIGQTTNLGLMNSQNAGFRIESRGGFTEAQAVVNENFPLFTIPRNESDMVQAMPPLNVPFGKYTTSSGSNILCYQKIGSVSTTQPLLIFSETQRSHNAILMGEGLWRWRIYEYIRSSSHANFDSFISRIVQFLAQNTDRSRFRVIYKTTHTENENIQLFAELYNANFELINDPDVSLNITDQNGRNYPYVFRKNASGYVLSIGRMNPGTYRFTASVKSEKYPYAQSGEFTVDAYNAELLNLSADHNLLKMMAENSGGIMVYPEEMNKISDALEERNAFQKTYSTQMQYQDLLEWKWLFFIILAFMTAEWVIRKREGFY